MLPIITVVIPTKNDEEDIGGCLSALKDQTFKKFKVLIVDGNSGDHTVYIAKNYKQYFTVNVIYESGGTRAYALNEALKIIDTPFFVTTDADCIPDIHWLEELMREFKKHGHTVAGLGGPNFGAPSDGAFAKCVDVVYTSKLVTGSARYGKVYGGLKQVDHNPGCNACYRNVCYNTTLTKECLFDETLPTAEDVVFDYKLRVRGLKILFTPDAVVWHKRRNTLKGFFKQLSRYGLGRSLANKKYPDLKNVLHVAPVFLIIGWPVLFFLPISISATLICTYLLACLYGAVNSTSHFKNLFRVLVATFLIPIAHIAWGLGYLRGMLK